MDLVTLIVLFLFIIIITRRTCAGLHAGSLVLLTLLLLGLRLVFRALVVVAAAPALVELPLGEHLPRCKKKKKKRSEGHPGRNHTHDQTERGRDENRARLLSALKEAHLLMKALIPP